MEAKSWREFLIVWAVMAVLIVLTIVGIQYLVRDVADVGDIVLVRRGDRVRIGTVQAVYEWQYLVDFNDGDEPRLVGKANILEKQ